MPFLKITGNLTKRLDIEADIRYVVGQYAFQASNPLCLGFIIMTEAAGAGMRFTGQPNFMATCRPWSFLALVWWRDENALATIAGTSSTGNSAFTLFLDSPATNTSGRILNT
jgi:hypothetical protein